MITKPIFIAALIWWGVSASLAQNPQGKIVQIWPEAKMPEVQKSEFACKVRKNGDRIISGTQAPSLEIFQAKSDKPTPFVIVCPGGGYKILSYDAEGTKVARRLAENGISAGVLSYRTPDNRAGALADLQRAVRFVRANAEQLNVAGDKIAVMGFSAGANLTARAANAQPSYAEVDKIDKEPPVPNLTGLIYPAYCDEPTFQQCWASMKKRESIDYNSDYAVSKELPVSGGTPAAFIVQALDDRAWVNSSVAYFLALKKAGVPVEFHMFDRGGHGFGMERPGELIGQWPDLFIAWLKKKFAELDAENHKKR